MAQKLGTHSQKSPGTIQPSLLPSTYMLAAEPSNAVGYTLMCAGMTYREPCETGQLQQSPISMIYFTSLRVPLPGPRGVGCVLVSRSSAMHPLPLHTVVATQ